MAMSSLADYGDLSRLRSWSRHSHYETPKSMRGVWRTSYQNSFNGKKIGYNPDKIIVDYFTGQRQVVPTRNSLQEERKRTRLNERARNGFRYWTLEKPKTTSCKYVHNWKIWNRGLQNCTWSW
ncbi:hypothetical protein MAR_011551 [Mya arenaria]|uniref:Uncharacterized protein n=1 Tax=Mya arenaria TaxID=6604 RepID=A0ABY7FW49_MYAAR|nr:uncharacterized protein LOC128216483 isoform X3 [Mya arenaria]WAR25847.1 hypothetical protein MAR_011551 [Mya arenaria]